MLLLQADPQPFRVMAIGCYRVIPVVVTGSSLLSLQGHAHCCYYKVIPIVVTGHAHRCSRVTPLLSQGPPHCCYRLMPTGCHRLAHAHCCYRVMPIGYLQDQGLLNLNASANTIPGVTGDAQAAANFFGDQCAANNNTNGPVFPPGVNHTARWPDLCQACQVLQNEIYTQHVFCCNPSSAEDP